MRCAGLPVELELNAAPAFGAVLPGLGQSTEDFFLSCGKESAVGGAQQLLQLLMWVHVQLMIYQDSTLQFPLRKK